MTNSAKEELRIYATSAVASKNGLVYHSAYTAVAGSPQAFMKDVAASFAAKFPVEQGYSCHGYAPPIEISRKAIEDVIASW